ncbi:MAG: hypothetical protein K2Y37_06585 [Pirellulales bacterium]|nr:hypothetical protein [Pirellulales bacterium]
MNRLPMFAVVAFAVCLLALATFAVGPVLMGGGPLDFNDFLPLILASLAGTLACFGWLALARAVPTREWLVALGLVAAWCLVIGLLTLMTNVNGRSYWAGQLRSAEERAYSTGGQADSKADSLTEEQSRQRIDDAREDIQQARESRDYKTKGCFLSLAMTAVGLVAAGRFALLFRQRARAA